MWGGQICVTLPDNYIILNQMTFFNPRTVPVALATAVFTLLSPLSFASIHDLGGFSYEHVTAPDGGEWQDPQRLALGKEQPHAWFFSFAGADNVLGVLPEYSSYYKNLDGEWMFHWSASPDGRLKGFEKDGGVAGMKDRIRVPSSWNVAGIGRDGTCKYGIPMYINQGTPFYHEVKVGDWKKGVMRVPPKNWTSYKYRNEVGQYRRSFTIPETWKGRRVYINFDGVDSFFYLWINGVYVGFSKNSRCLAQFDITPWLRKGDNTVAVEVYRSSDGSFLETQDMFRMAGIIRSVYLTSKPEAQIRDLVIIPDIDDHLQNGELKVTTRLRNLGKKSLKNLNMSYELYPVKLYQDITTLKPVDSWTAPVGALLSGEDTALTVRHTVTGVQAWSAEAPWRYVLVARLTDKRGKVIETTSSYTGFRKVEIRNTAAQNDEFGIKGRYFYVNGRAIKLKGVNRHETSPEMGHAVTRARMMADIMLMKRGNINHVRDSHYPDDPYWYYLCDKYGIYLEDEGNIESHMYYYGKESLSHVPEMTAAHVARDMEMVHANVNHPSIVIWSLGNEAGPGDNFKACYSAIKAFDTSRPIQYERNNDIVDMGSNQYPSVDGVRSIASGKYDFKYPFHISEYGHSMGNATGNLADYWKAIESTNFICGGAIWEWVDHGLYNYRPDGRRYVAYGGDFGDYPNDGTFCLDGVMMADLTPKPQYYEVKKVYQNVAVSVDRPLDSGEGRIAIFNKNYFKALDYDITWTLYADGQKVSSGKFPHLRDIAPRAKALVPLRIDPKTLRADKEYFLTVDFMLRSDMPWAHKGYVQASEQLPVRRALRRASVADAAAKHSPLTVSAAADVTSVSGDGFRAEFDNKQGTLLSLSYGGRDVIVRGQGPKLDAFRAPVDNDNWVWNGWYAAGLNDLRHSVLSSQSYKRADGTLVLSYRVKSQASGAYRRQGGTSGHIHVVRDSGRNFGESDFMFLTNEVWTVYPDGSIELNSAITSTSPSLVLPRLGYVMRVPAALERYTYYGRGPVNNYPDRKTGQFIGRYEQTVRGQFVSYGKPQSMSNNEDVRWCALTDSTNRGVVFVSRSKMSTSALAYSEQALDTAAHPIDLPAPGDTYLHLDCGVTGLGGNSCGQGGPLDPDRIKAGAHELGFVIRPVSGDIDSAAAVSLSGETPVNIVRSKTGEVSISATDTLSQVWYIVNGGKAKCFSKPFDLSAGGTVTAWRATTPQLRSTASFSKIESVPVEVIFASSVETGEGEASHLVDGDPETYWHTMYSVTVANYPHWVDFDAGKPKMMKGFTYLPRQDSRNGRIKGYRVQVSMDGKNWGEAVASGEFEDNAKEKRVLFSKPVRARYLRFTALSSCDGQDFATGAEMTILAE